MRKYSTTLNPFKNAGSCYKFWTNAARSSGKLLSYIQSLTRFSAPEANPGFAWLNSFQKPVPVTARAQGYCTHNHLRFPTWHRAFLLLFEVWESIRKWIYACISELLQLAIWYAGVWSDKGCICLRQAANCNGSWIVQAIHKPLPFVNGLDNSDASHELIHKYAELQQFGGPNVELVLYVYGKLSQWAYIHLDWRWLEYVCTPQDLLPRNIISEIIHFLFSNMHNYAGIPMAYCIYHAAYCIAAHLFAAYCIASYCIAVYCGLAYCIVAYCIMPSGVRRSISSYENLRQIVRYVQIVR